MTSCMNDKSFQDVCGTKTTINYRNELLVYGLGDSDVKEFGCIIYVGEQIDLLYRRVS